MSKIDRKLRWSSGMDVLNVILPATVTHKQMVAMSRQLYLMDYKLRPLDSDKPYEPHQARSVRDIIEFLGSRVRFIVMEDENLDVCELRIEFIGEDRYPISGESFFFEMRRA